MGLSVKGRIFLRKMITFIYCICSLLTAKYSWKKEWTLFISVQVSPFDLVFVSFYVSREAHVLDTTYFFLSIFDPKFALFFGWNFS